LIKPIHKTIDLLKIVSEDAIIPKEEQELHRIDLQVNKISKKLNLSSKLRPTNYFNELDKFITLHGNYNPVFSYKRPSQESLGKASDDLRKVKIKTVKLESPMKQFFLEKIDELTNRLLLIKAYKEQNFKDIETYNEKLFGAFDDNASKISKEKILNRQIKESGEESVL
jgi:hypothetical protein